MARYANKPELASKVEWEGGLVEAVLGYGITAEDLPEDTPQNIVHAWKRIEAVRPDVDLIGDWLDPS